MKQEANATLWLLYGEVRDTTLNKNSPPLETGIQHGIKGSLRMVCRPEETDKEHGGQPHRAPAQRQRRGQYAGVAIPGREFSYYPSTNTIFTAKNAEKLFNKKD